jgi:hypothetical protein
VKGQKMVKKQAEKVNQSKAVREYLATNPKAKVSEIIENLAKKGITISKSVASYVKYAEKNGKTRVNRTVKKLASQRWSLKDLTAAKEFVKNCGGFKQARSLVEALETLAP